jgi:hypothetical protein
MATNPRRFQVTELDFDDIKSNLKTFLKAQTEFTDYDFEGSGMNILLDTLAYNTHYLAYNVNMAMNEAFLDSALLRSSVVSHAKSLGYTPRSARAPVAYVNVTLNNNTLVTATLEKGSVFTTSVDEVDYTFVTNSDYTISRLNGLLTFTNVPLYEGTLITTKYTVDKSNVDQRFILASDRADTTTLNVSVQNSSSDTTTTVYNLAEDITTVTGDQASYFLQETEDGKFQVYFGDGVVGQELSDGNIVILEYVVTNKTAANSASVFSPPGDINSVANITVSTVAAATGGAEPEILESIRYNAPLDFSSQGRAVTVEDYKLLIPRVYPGAQSVQVWGGEDNDPPKYGEVFASIKTPNNSNLTESQKNTIITSLDKYNIASVRVTILNPEVTYLDVVCSFKYNSNKTTKTKNDLETIVRNTITNYSDVDLEKFDGVFRYSKLSRLIDNSDTSILSNVMRVKMKKKFTPIINQSTQQYIIKFSNALYHPHEGHNAMFGGITQSTGFVIASNSNTVYIDDDGNGNLRLYYLVSGTQRTYIDNAAGTINYATGELVLSALNIESVSNSDGTIEIVLIPNSYDVAPVRNQLIEIDTNTLNITGEVDAIETGGSIAGSGYTTTGVLY